MFCAFSPPGGLGADCFIVEHEALDFDDVKEHPPYPYCHWCVGHLKTDSESGKRGRERKKFNGFPQSPFFYAHVQLYFVSS